MSVLDSDKIFDSIVTISPMVNGDFELSFIAVWASMELRATINRKKLRKRCFIRELIGMLSGFRELVKYNVSRGFNEGF